MASFVQWRALIGPRFDHYDWTGINTDATTSLDIAGTPTSTLSSSGTTLALSSAVSFPTSGGVFIGPSLASATEGWEYCKYTEKSGNSLTGLIRESSTTREHNGVHTAGSSIAYFWYPISTDNGELSFSWQMNQPLAASTWEANISGVSFPHGIFINNHLCTIQYRQTTTAAWKIFCLGMIDSPSVQDDYKYHATWALRIVSSSQLLNKQPVKGVKVGELDIAKQGTASGSASLVLASDERSSGDYIAAEPDFSVSSMVDDDNSTIAIFERFHGPEQTYRMNNGDAAQQYALRFSQLHLLPAAGLPPGARWIELINTDNSSYENYELYAADPLSPNNTYYWDMPSSSGIDELDFIVLCENESIYRELNPLSDPAAIFENKELFSRLTHTGGAIRLKQPPFWRNYITWGNGNGGLPGGGTWTGPAMPVLTPGQTYRYIHGRTGLTNSKDWWDASMTKTPGYHIAEDYNTHAIIELPGIDLFLDGDITASVPANGGHLKIKDKAGNSSTSGLPASGTIIIGDEQFNYSVKSSGAVTLSAARGFVGGAAAAHKDADPIYVMVSGVKTAGPPVSQISWHHYNGSVHIRDFTIHRSLSTLEPRSPDEDATLTDWTSVTSVVGNTASSWSYTFSPIQRIKYLMMRISKTNNAPSRPRINDFRAILDTTAYQSGLWLASGQTAYQLVRQVVLNAGFPGNSIVQSGTGHPTLDKQTTADSTAWTVAADIADFSGCRLMTGRDSKMSLAVDTFWTGGTPSPAQVWTKSNAATVDKVFSNGIGVSQVRLPWRTADGATKGVEVYPATADTFGEAYEQTEHIYANASAAQTAARKYYYLNRYPYTVVVDSPDGNLFLEPGQVHRLQWKFTNLTAELNRLYMVTAIEHNISKNQLSTSVNLMQIEREAEN